MSQSPPKLLHRFSKICLAWFVVLFAVISSLQAKVYTVSNATEFNALPSLKAGDVVQLQSGIYGALNKNIISTITSDEVAQANPIKIYAVKPGGVVVNAPSYLLFSGRGILFAGVDFGAGCGLLSNSDILCTDYHSRYITFSHLRFNACGSTNANGEDVHWIRLRGFNNTIEYCSFTERPETSRNVTVEFMPDISEGGIDVPRNHSIRYCYFGTRYAPASASGSDSDNGFESIRIGVGDVQTFDMRVNVEKNVFYRSIWRTDGTFAGEPEIISNKSKGNTIRNNTILETQGGICLRTGQNCTVEGNFIFGGGYYSGNSIVTGTPSTRQSGIRVIGKNHIIRNNYVANVLGTDARAALCVMSGESNYYEGDPVNALPNVGSYLPADNAQIYNNTFLNCAEINLGYLAPDSYANAASPAGVKIFNNVWQGNGTADSAIKRDTTVASGYSPIVLGGSDANYVYETSNSKYGWDGLGGRYSASVSPAITEVSGNYKIPTASSPLLNGANATLSASTDIRGFARPDSGRDIGCYEREATGTTAFAPMLRKDVGAVFDGGPTVPSYYPTVSLYESFESYSTGAPIPTIAAPASSAVKSSGQVTATSGNSLIGTGGKVAWLNDIISAAGGSGQIEFNACDSPQTTLAVSFEILNNATPSGNGTQPINIGLLAWSTAVATSGGSSSKRICGVTFNQLGSLTAPAFSIQGGVGGNTSYSGTYDLSKKQSVNIYANDHDTQSINYLGPDGSYRTLSANSFSIFLNQIFVGLYGLNTSATDNSGVLLTGNGNLGRIGFNTSTTNLGNWLIDNVSMSPMPSGVVIPNKTTLTSPTTATGQAGISFNYTPTYTGIAPDTYSIIGTLPLGLTFDPDTGIISGASNQSGNFTVTLTATSSLGDSSLTVAMSFSAAPANTFGGSNSSLNTFASWSLASPPTASTYGGSYTDLVFNSSSTNLTTTSGNINGKSYNVSNGSSYVLSSLRALADTGGTIFKIGNTGATDSAPFNNVFTSNTNELVSLTNNSSLTFSPASPSNSIPSILQLRNSGTLRIETGSTLDIQTAITQSTTGLSLTKTGGGKLILSGNNSHSGNTTISNGTLTLSGTNVSSVTIKSGAVLELPLSSTSNASAILSGALVLESGSKVRIVGTPTANSTSTLLAANSISNLATLETAIPGFELGASGDSLVLRPATPIDEFETLRKKWRDTLIADVTSSKTTSSINSRAVLYQTTMYGLAGIKVVNGGTGYTTAPTVAITGGGGTGATATATISAGKVSSIALATSGTGYTTVPTITLSGGGGSGATATPLLAMWSDLPPAAQTGVTADVASGNIADSFKRLEYMAQAYAIPGCALYQDPTLLTAITGGLDWLTANFYTSTGTIFGNWYDWMVSAPQSLNNAAILILSNPSALTPTQIANYVKAVYNFGPNSVNQKDYFWWGALTGANTSNAALTMAVQGILLGNNTTTVRRFWHNTAGHPVNPQTDYTVSGSLMLAEAQGNLSGNNPLDWSGDSVFTPVTSGDGWYADFSFIYHYNIAYTGSYGQELMENISILVKLLDGSTWEITDPEVSNLYGWITNGFAPLMYRGAMMDMVRGRAIASSSSDESKVGAKVIANIRSIATFAPTDIASQLLAFADSPQLSAGQYHFPSMDRVAAHRNGFSFGLSMSSTRVGGYEINTTSPTNLKGWYTGAGVTYLYLGNPDTQYMDSYWATVDWYHLPGTTADLSATPDDAVTDQNWVGGAQVDKTYGVAGMSAHPAGTQLYAKKSWFMLDDKIVCLGAGITCNSSGQVDTTVENRRLGKTGTTAFNIADTAYSLSANVTWANPVTVTTSTSPTWCALEGVGGYYFPNGASNLQAQFTSDSGSWKTINPTDSDAATYTDYYLKLLFKHGANPTGAKYAYFILPNRAASSVKAYASNPDVTILSNTEPTGTSPGIQAVKSNLLGVLAANFWAKTSGPDTGGTVDFITVSKQSSVIVKETNNSISVGLADPTQNNTGNITVTLNGRASLGTLSIDPRVTVTGTNPISLIVNVNGSKGKSFNASFSLAAAPVITSQLVTVGLNGTALNYQITANGTAVSYGATGLPNGISINASTGLISGTPTVTGSFQPTIFATNAGGRSGYATLAMTIANSASDISYTHSTSGTWICPANVTSVQVECWGAGGAGGSAYKPSSGNTFGGGGAGGSYAKKISIPVVPGTTYTTTIGSGGVSQITHLATASGGDSWFGIGSDPSCLAKGGSGGQSVVSSSSSVSGSGGVGNSTGCIGDIAYSGGNGLAGQLSPTNTGGGGGSSAGTSSAGVNATSYLGATAVSGAGAGGNGKDSTGNGNGSAGNSPGGGGGGARGSSAGSQVTGGTGGSGQIIITVKTIATPTPTQATITLENLTQSFDGTAKTVSATTSPIGLTYTITYNGLPTPPTTVGTYTVVTTITQSGYSGNATGTLTISDSPAAWRQMHFSTVANSGNAADAADPDGDALTNIQEYIFGTLPMSAQPALLALFSPSSGNITLTFTGKEATGAGFTGLVRHYRVEKSPSLAVPDWQALTGYENISAGNSTISITQPTSGETKSFYRLKAWLE
jgi:hyaluronate lyase